MKDLFITIASRLEALSALKWIDLDKGQLDRFDMRPSLSFPCALIGVQITRTHKLSHQRQRCDALVTVRLAVNFSGNTSAITPGVARRQALDYFDLADLVYMRLHGWGTSAFNELERQAVREERRTDGIKVVSIPFTTSFVQDTKPPGMP
jgi:hypothetical protein